MRFAMMPSLDKETKEKARFKIRFTLYCIFLSCSNSIACSMLSSVEFVHTSTTSNTSSDISSNIILLYALEFVRRHTVF